MLRVIHMSHVGWIFCSSLRINYYLSIRVFHNLRCCLELRHTVTNIGVNPMHDLIMWRISSRMKGTLWSCETSHHLSCLELKLFDTPILSLCIQLINLISFYLLVALSFYCVDVFAAIVVWNTIFRLLIVQWTLGLSKVIRRSWLVLLSSMILSKLSSNLSNIEALFV